MNKAKMRRFPRSKVWDKGTQQTVDTLRAFMHREPQPTISDIQNASIKPRPLKGPFLAKQNVLQAPPEDDVRRLLFEVITQLGDVEYEPPDLAHVPVEWVSKSPAAVESEHRDSLTTPSLQECDTGPTILHVHGGAFL